MLPPITPRPMKPSLAMQRFPFTSARFRAADRRLFLGRLAGERRRILNYLVQMGAHRLSRRLGISPLDRRENPFVMKLSPLWSSLHVKNAAALLAQQNH